MQNVWQLRVAEYWKEMRVVLQRNSIRNVMDMNSNLGGFAAALVNEAVWVMNVAPVNSSAKLKIVYDRGLLGTVHDWYALYLVTPSLNLDLNLLHYLLAIPFSRHRIGFWLFNLLMLFYYFFFIDYLIQWLLSLHLAVLFSLILSYHTMNLNYLSILKIVGLFFY